MDQRTKWKLTGDKYQITDVVDDRPILSKPDIWLEYQVKEDTPENPAGVWEKAGIVKAIRAQHDQSSFLLTMANGERHELKYDMAYIGEFHKTEGHLWRHGVSGEETKRCIAMAVEREPQQLWNIAAVSGENADSRREEAAREAAEILSCNELYWKYAGCEWYSFYRNSRGELFENPDPYEKRVVIEFVGGWKSVVAGHGMKLRFTSYVKRWGESNTAQGEFMPYKRMIEIAAPVFGVKNLRIKNEGMSGIIFTWNGEETICEVGQEAVIELHGGPEVEPASMYRLRDWEISARPYRNLSLGDSPGIPVQGFVIGHPEYFEDELTPVGDAKRLDVDREQGRFLITTADDCRYELKFDEMAMQTLTETRDTLNRLGISEELADACIGLTAERHFRERRADAYNIDPELKEAAVREAAKVLSCNELYCSFAGNRWCFLYKNEEGSICEPCQLVWLDSQERVKHEIIGGGMRFCFSTKGYEGVMPFYSNMISDEAAESKDKVYYIYVNERSKNLKMLRVKNESDGEIKIIGDQGLKNVIAWCR